MTAIRSTAGVAVSPAVVFSMTKFSPSEMPLKNQSRLSVIQVTTASALLPSGILLSLIKLAI